MRLIRKSLTVKAIHVTTMDKQKCVTLLNKGFTYRSICGSVFNLEKNF